MILYLPSTSFAFHPSVFLRAYRNIFRVHVPIEVEHPFSSMALAWTWTCMSAAFRLAGSLTNTNWFFEVSDRLRYFDQLIVHVIDLNLILQQIPNYLPMAMEILVIFFWEHSRLLRSSSADSLWGIWIGPLSNNSLSASFSTAFLLLFLFFFHGYSQLFFC